VYAIRVQPRVAEIQAVRKQALDKARADSIAAQAPPTPPAENKPAVENKPPGETKPAGETPPAPTTKEAVEEGRREKKTVPPQPDPNQKKLPEGPDAEPTW
jgi:hypothetical protein